VIAWTRRVTTCLAPTMVGTVCGLALATTAAFSQQPADTTKRPRPTIDTTRAPQPIEGVRIEARPDPKPATPAEDRARFGGRVYTPKDFERVGAQGWTDVVRMTPGVSFESQPAVRGSTLRRRRLQMKGGAGSWTGYCTPAVYVDGARYYGDQNSDTDWDQILALDLIKRIEVYSVATVPQQFKAMDNGGCGSILLWSHEERPADEKKSP
jgi:hypothetical protein